MNQPRILLCGATGVLGGGIARKLHERGVPFRALVRPSTDPCELSGLAAEIARGDIRDPASLAVAMDGIETVVSTVNAIGRVLGGERGLTIHDVDDVGYANLITAAEAAGADRFVYVSVLDDLAHADTPFTDAKLRTEERLRASRLHEVIVRSDQFREIWLGPDGGFDLEHGKVTIYGRGIAHHRLVATDDVAEAVVRVALAPDPPRIVDLAGPDAMSVQEAVDAFELALGHSHATRHIPRLLMRVGKTVARGMKPGIASIMGMALAGDVVDTTAGPEGFHALGIDPQPVRLYIAHVAAGA